MCKCNLLATYFPGHRALIACSVAEAGVGDPAPSEGAVPRPAAASQTAAADEK